MIRLSFPIMADQMRYYWAMVTESCGWYMADNMWNRLRLKSVHTRREAVLVGFQVWFGFQDFGCLLW